MGCAMSKGAALGSPGYEVSSASGYEAVSGSASASASIWSRPVRLEALDLGGDGEEPLQEGVRGNIVVAGGGTVRLGNLHRYIECEQVAAGWPAWLRAVAAEAVQGWVPLKAENFEKLEKIGQGTYSSVFRARSLETGRVVALKKVRFDSVEPESVRFMAREIVILRRLQGHPNVVGLHGLITSRSSPSIYLVFEYMEHDLAGLASASASATDHSFSQPQIKCYMRQLLAGLEHCHARGVMHRDIKCANLLVSADGQLKIADFGLANLVSSSPLQPPLTSRVVTLWYRPPELLLGATAYDPTVDLWSAGCVFAELHARHPVLQGRTEVEQIHKIFKLCGSPPDAYWRRLGTVSSSSSVFRPQVPYESRLGQTFGPAMPEAALRLLRTLLSVEPAARGTASSALASDYFAHASEPPSGLIPPRCAAPNREMDAKLREEDSRRRNETAKRLSRSHRSTQDTSSSQRHHGHVHAEESLPLEVDPVVASKRHDVDAPPPQPCARQEEEDAPAPARLADHIALSAGPVQLAASTGFAWAKKPRVPDAAATKRSSSRRTNNTDGGDAAGARTTTTTTAPYEVERQEMIKLKQWAQVAEAFGSSQPYTSSRSIRELPLDGKQLKTSKKHKGKKMERVDYSGPLLSRVDDLLQSHEQQIRRAGRRSWFHKGSKREQQHCERGTHVRTP